MRPLSNLTFRELLASPARPSVSIYQPTHRGADRAGENLVLFQCLLGRALDFLLRRYPSREVRALSWRLRTCLRDAAVWERVRDGLAVFVSADRFEVMHLQEPVRPTVVVADRFHVQPAPRNR